jgi:hypothetical protein
MQRSLTIDEAIKVDNSKNKANVQTWGSWLILIK